MPRQSLALNGEALPESAPKGTHPTPFVHIPDFLTAARQDVLLDAVQEGPEHFAAAFSRIEPVNNSLVFFPSDYYHEMLPVHAKSEAFENVRFTVNG